MAKPKFTDEDDALLDELGVETDAPPVASRSPREERIIAGFEDIERFFQQQGRLPINSEGRDIFERLYAVRLDAICGSEECRAVLAGLGKDGLLHYNPAVAHSTETIHDDDELLAELGVLDSAGDDITKLTHVRTRTEIRAAEEVAKRTPCPDFDKFKPLFRAVQDDLKTGVRQGRRFKVNATIEEGEFFILGGQIAYVAAIGAAIKAPNGSTDARLRVIYDNGTESDLLMRSLQRALYKDEAGRRITDPSPGPLFSEMVEEGDIESGTVYILRSKSDHPFIKEHRDVIHKIGVTGGDLDRRLAIAKLDPTYLMADVEVVATYDLSNVNRAKLENLIHTFFDEVRLNIEIKDRFGNPVVPREWFLVPLPVIDNLICKIRSNEVLNYNYNPDLACLELL